MSYRAMTNDDYMSSDDVQLLESHVKSTNDMLVDNNFEPKIAGIQDGFGASDIEALQTAPRRASRLIVVDAQPKHDAMKQLLSKLLSDPNSYADVVEFDMIESFFKETTKRRNDYTHLHLCVEYDETFGSSLSKLCVCLAQNEDFLKRIDEVNYHIKFDPSKNFSEYSDSEKAAYDQFIKALSRMVGSKVAHCSILNKYDINTVYLTERADLTTLGHEIEEDIKHWPNLRILDYGENCIRFLPGVKLPDSLEVLNISGSYSIETLTGFKMPPNLKHLLAYNNVITSLDNINFPLALEVLDLADNKIYFLSYVEFPSSLKKLNLMNNRIDNIRGIDFPRFLESLNISNNPIDNIRGAKFPESLKYLDVSCIPNEAMTGVKFPDSIVSLNLQESMTNTRGLKLPINLKDLNLGNNGVNSINPLKLPNTIENLYLANNNIKTLNKVAFPLSLRQLYLGNNMITTLKNVIFPSGLEVLDLEMDPDQDDNDKRISSLKDVVFPNSLRELKLGYQAIKSLEAMEFPNSLTFLDLSYNELKLIRNVTFGENLKVLDLSGNQELVDLDHIFIPDSVTDLRIPSQMMHNLPAYIVERANKKELILTKSLPF